MQHSLCVSLSELLWWLVHTPFIKVSTILKLHRDFFTEKKSLWLNSNVHTYCSGYLDGAMIAHDAGWYFFLPRCLRDIEFSHILSSSPPYNVRQEHFECCPNAHTSLLQMIKSTKSFKDKLIKKQKKVTLQRLMTQIHPFVFTGVVCSWLLRLSSSSTLLQQLWQIHRGTSPSRDWDSEGTASASLRPGASRNKAWESAGTASANFVAWPPGSPFVEFGPQSLNSRWHRRQHVCMGLVEKETTVGDGDQKTIDVPCDQSWPSCCLQGIHLFEKNQRF